MKDLASEEPEQALALDVSQWPDFVNAGLGPFEEMSEACADLRETLADIEAIVGDKAATKIRRMSVELDRFAPAITFIGQIKSGKTSLVNAIAGRPGLLPADVNPWTSVVTSLHLGHQRDVDAPAASFTFFEADEWDRLVESGGRIGELSERTGADKEHERLHTQIAAMHEKTRERLGRKFELLLGQTHSYQTIAPDLIPRYVCLGDDFETASARERQGQFADITRSAELYLNASHLPHALTLRDTPGMNDTFLMREQITIRAIRDSKICCVVLSAHQALNAVDMGLIRMISNVKSRQIVIFVNRIDELSSPHEQIPEIRESLLQTLADKDGSADPCIIFGSAMWAEAALTDQVGALPPASISALESYGSSADGDQLDDLDERSAVWTLSGVPALMEQLGERILEGAGDKVLTDIRKRAANVVSGLRASSSIVTLRANSDQIQKMTHAEVEARLNQIAETATAKLDATLDEVFTAFAKRVDQAHTSYIGRALDAMLQHFERNGNDQVWSYNADGLRLLMRSAYQVMHSRFNKKVGGVLDDVVAELTTAYGDIFDITPENFSVETPGLPDLPPPVTLAQMIALDVKTSWWKDWWGQRKGWRAYADGFRELIEAETTPMVDDLKIGQVAEIRALAHATLQELLSEQRSVLADICDKAQIALEDLHGLFGVTSQQEREDLFEMIYHELGMYEDEIGEAA
ncbi:MAG: dynamin family protein [Pseudomonadota bacterium]